MTNSEVHLSYKRITIPLMGVSLMFFCIYVVGLSWVVAEGTSKVLMAIFPEFGFSTVLTITAILSVLLMLSSFIASVLAILELKKQALNWMNGALLCFVMGTIALLLLLLLVCTAFGSTSVLLKYPVFVIEGGLLILPSCATFFFKYVKETSDAISDMDMKISYGVAIAGIIVFIYSVFSLITYSPPTRLDIWQFEPAGLIIVWIFYLAFLLPVTGILFLKLGLRQWFYS